MCNCRGSNYPVRVIHRVIHRVIRWKRSDMGDRPHPSEVSALPLPRSQNAPTVDLRRRREPPPLALPQMNPVPTRTMRRRHASRFGPESVPSATDATFSDAAFD